MDSNRFQFKWRKIKSGLVATLCFACALAVITPLGLVLFYLVKSGAGAIDWHFFTHLPKPVGEAGGGMANAIGGTMVLLALASALAVPVGVLGGVYLSEYAAGRSRWLIRFVADILNGTPSIVWGIVVYALIVLPVKSFSAYAGGVALGFIMIPLIVRTTEEMLSLVPNGYREAAFALGIARWKVILHIVMKTARRGIITGVLLALARGAALVYRIRKPLLEPRARRADRRAAIADFHLRHFPLRRLASASLGRSVGADHHRARVEHRCPGSQPWKTRARINASNESSHASTKA
jgi:phosphate ABC transporter permease subunit PstA